MKTLLTLFVLFFSSSVVAEDHNISGIGAIALKCSEIILSIENATEKTANESITIERYIRASMIGFLSGMNKWHEEKFGTYKNLGIDEDAFIFTYVMNECKKNPEEPMAQIIIDYLFSLPDLEKD